jgi:uncharacterized spore protein YtfJ
MSFPCLLQGQPRLVGEKTLTPIALVADIAGGRKRGVALFYARPLAVREASPAGERLIPILPIAGIERRLGMEPGSLLKEISDRLKSSASVDVVFGETRETQGKAVIPVASVHYCFGAGSGEGTSAPSSEGQPPVGGSGGGGGGMVRAKPVAVLEVTPEETRVIPIFDLSRLASMALGGILFLWVLRTLRRKRK